MNPDIDAPIFEVRYKTSFSANCSALGAIIAVIGIVLIVLTENTANLGLIVSGAAILAFGFRSFSRPYCLFDSAAGALYQIALFGGGHRKYGPAMGEQLQIDGKHLVRHLPNGKRRKLNMNPADPEDLARLAEHLPSA